MSTTTSTTSITTAQQPCNHGEGIVVASGLVAGPGGGGGVWLNHAEGVVGSPVGRQLVSRE